MLETIIEPLPTKGDINTNAPVWIEALPARVFHTKQYGEVPITVDKLQRMVRHFKENVRGQEIEIDYDHKLDRAKGNKAAGWLRDVAIRPSSSDAASPALWVQVEFSEEAKSEIRDRQWKYFSLEWDDVYHDTQTGAKFDDVVTGGGITNRPIAKNTLPINFSETMLEELDEATKKELTDAGIDISAESKEWEHSEPGTGSPPTPRTDEDGSDDPAIQEGWRRETPPIATEPESTKGGNKVGELTEQDLRELRNVLDIDDDGKILETTKVKFAELNALRDAVSAADQERVFAEQYPQYWKEHNLLVERDRETSAKAFSESVSRIRKTEGYGLKDTKSGLSVQAKEKIAEVHKKFSEGKATTEDFEECIKAITNGGILEFGEIGSSNGDDDVPEFSTETATGVAGARKMFAEAVAKVQKDNPDMPYLECIDEAGKKYPDLAEAYRINLPA